MKSLLLLVFCSCAAAYVVCDEEVLQRKPTACVNDDDIESLCESRSVIKRSTRQAEMGPFWANRGKKSPTFTRSTFYVEEPRWSLVRRDDGERFDPFFMTRGKKLQRIRNFVEASRERRNQAEDYLDALTPFLAARGKRDDYSSN